jgi:hypothetical protein
MRRCRTNLARLLSIIPVIALTVACLPKTKPVEIELPTGEKVEARHVRVWVYELTNLLAGRLERAANDILHEADDAQVRLAALEWKAEGIPALQRASFNPDPMIGMADVWLFVIQMQDFLQEERGFEVFGEHVDTARKATLEMEQEILEFSRAKGGKPIESGTSDMIHKFAAEYPIRSTLTSRPSVASVLDEGVKTGSMGAFAAVGSLVEGFGDLSDRLAIYAEHLPKQARWQAELLLFDKGIESIDVDALLGDTARLGRAADRLVDFTEDLPLLIDASVEDLLPEIERIVASIDIDGVVGSADEMAARHLAVALAAVTIERESILEAVTEERIAALADAERMANEVVDRSFERVDRMVEAAVDRLMPVGVALMAGPFVLGLLAGFILRRRAPQA